MVAVCLVGFAQAAVGEFVPFVIPAVQNEKSAIATESVPIRGEADRVVVKSGHFYTGGERIRFWGVNLSFAANLPTHADAEKISRRMAAAGVNAVRLHHLDTSWYPRGWWKSKDGKGIEPEAFDRLDYFINQFAKNGIYVNLNLHVGREHSNYIGLPKSNRQYDKISNIFTPALIDAQKDFAKEVLGHVNKYRDLSYADDPAIAIIEITNENSFFMWSSEDTLRTLPEYYEKILRGQYNGWLKKRYGTTSRLEELWSEGAQTLGADMLVNGDFAEKGRLGLPEKWNLEQHSGCKAEESTVTYKGVGGIRIKPVELNGTDWHLQFNQAGMALKEGQYYTVTFRAAAETSRSIQCNVSMAHEPWGSMGLSRKIEIETEWHAYRLGFVSKSDDENVRITFVLGGDKAAVYLADLKVRSGGLEGLAKGESIEEGTVKLFGESDAQMRSLDRLRFLAETEKTYFDDMKSYIQKDIGSKSLVTGTIVFGPLGMYGQSDMDFIDGHSYWQHPRFPNKPWDQGDWLIDQKPMTDYFDEATLFRLSGERMAGKPFTVTEYNHPAPLDSQAECVPMIASWAALQDWDGVWLYTYSHSGDTWDRKVMSSFFDIDTNPAKWGFMRAAATLFADEWMAPLASEFVVGLAESGDVLGDLAKLHSKYDTNMLGVISEKGGLGREDLLSNSVAGRLSSRSLRVNKHAARSRLKWSVDEEGKGLYLAQGSGGWAVTGHSERVESATRGLISISSPEFVSLTSTTLDDADLYNSKQVLITVCGRCENTGMKFSADRRTVGRQWGDVPVQVETVEGRMRLIEGDWKCEALGPDGVPVADVPVSSASDGQFFDMSGKYKTMWYLLRRLDIQEMNK